MAKDRFRAKPGSIQTMSFNGPVLVGPLYKAALVLPPEPKQAVKEKKPNRPIKVPDETVLAIRRLHRDGKSIQEIEKLYPDIKHSTIYQFIHYITRGNLLLPEDKVRKSA